MTSVETAKKLIETKGICSGINCDDDRCPCGLGVRVCERTIGDASIESMQTVEVCKQYLLEQAAEEASTLPLYSDTQKNDPVNHPDHYTSGGMQCWDAIKASMTHEAFCGYLKGNVQKYIWRYEKKVAPVEDLRKASVYLNKLIEELNDNTPNS